MCGFFTYKASDLSPFKDFDYAIEPSLKKQAKRDYNKIVDVIFYVLNSQTRKLDNSQILKLSSNGVPPIIEELNKELKPLLDELSEKYTPKIKGKLIKYFVCKHIIAILDNYYIGPHIYIEVPDMPYYGIKAFPFIYDAKRVPGSKPGKGSKIAPFKYFVHNIPADIRNDVTKLYDNLLRKYMRILNSLVSKLREVNNRTLMAIDWNSFMIYNTIDIQDDLFKIQRIIGLNSSSLLQSILMTNVLPILNKYYKGPSINFTIPASIPANPHLLSVNFPNTDKNRIFTVVPGCLEGEGIRKVKTGSYGYIKQCVKIR
jgi:hypothetical protein